MGNREIEVQDFWVEVTARKVGFDRVGESVLPPVLRSGHTGVYLLVGTILFVHGPILSAMGYTQTGIVSFAVNPAEFFLFPAWLALVWLLFRTKPTYSVAVNELPNSIDNDLETDEGTLDLSLEGPLTTAIITRLGVPRDPSGKADVQLETIAPDRLKYGLLALGLGFHFTQLMLSPETLTGPVKELAGPVVATVRFYIIIPFLLYPIGAEIVAVILGTLVLLPFKIRRASIIDFSDPHGYGGLDAAGNLFKSVSVSYFILLALFTTFQTIALGTDPGVLFSSVLIIAGLVVGLVLFFAPVYWIRQYVAALKEATIETFAAQSERVGSTDDLIPYAEPETVDDTSRYMYNQIRMQRVDSTREFPVDLSMIQQVLVGLVLPYITS